MGPVSDFFDVEEREATFSFASELCEVVLARAGFGLLASASGLMSTPPLLVASRFERRTRPAEAFMVI